MSMLLKGGNLAARHSSHTQWYMAFASYSGVAGVGWPLESVVIGGKLIYRPSVTATSADTVLLHILELSEWKAFAFKWWGPLHIRVETGHVLAAVSLAAAPECVPDLLLRVVARKVGLGSFLCRFSV